MKTQLIPLSAMLLALGLSGCRSLVLEERTGCPSRMVLHADREVSEDSWPYFSFRMLNRESQRLQRQVARTWTFCTEGVRFDWTKNSPLEIVCVSGWDQELSEGEDRLLIPLGRECPESLAGWLEVQTAEAEQYSLEMPVRSLYATLYCDVRMPEKEIPLRPVVTGTVDGFTLPGLKLHEGPYEATARQIGEHLYAVRIPRQDRADGKAVYAPALKLDLETHAEESSAWEPFYTLNVGELATQQGYDWSRPILNDIYVRLTLDGSALLSCTIRVNEWETGVVLLEHWRSSL